MTGGGIGASASDGDNNDDDVRGNWLFMVANTRDGAHVTSSSNSSTTTTSEDAEQDIRFFVCILHLRNIRAFMAFPQLMSN